MKGEEKVIACVCSVFSHFHLLRIKNKQLRARKQDVGKFMQTFLVMFVVIDRVESITEHFAVTVALVSSNAVSEEGRCIRASVGRKFHLKI